MRCLKRRSWRREFPLNLKFNVEAGFLRSGTANCAVPPVGMTIGEERREVVRPASEGRALHESEIRLNGKSRSA